MAAKKSGLGRGLDALFADNAVEESAATNNVKLKIMDIEPNRDQPRKVFDEAALAELSDSFFKRIEVLSLQILNHCKLNGFGVRKLLYHNGNFGKPRHSRGSPAAFACNKLIAG